MAEKRVAYVNAHILRLTRDGLEYLDDDGIACAVDFHACEENVQKELRGPGWIRVGESKDIYIGFRDFGDTPAHITLASDPPTRFEFPDYRAFCEFQLRLMQAGVTTLDMA
jgi:hypothetical protein